MPSPKLLEALRTYLRGLVASPILNLSLDPEEWANREVTAQAHHQEVSDTIEEDAAHDLSLVSRPTIRLRG